MSASFQTKHLIRAGVAILSAWLVVFAVMFVAFYDYLPRKTGTAVFLASSSCVFPYETFILSESTKMVLTIAHWTLSIVAFTIAGSRLPMRWALGVALLSIPLLAVLGRAVLHVIGL
ncbi:MAG: hypothetical protein HOP33_19000 [Verrucomicrobia bacterium]|nr:hypothetical protein [Verrucomicrobiota bacterium]